MSGNWIEISCEVPAALADDAADRLAAITGMGVCTENLAVDAFSHDEITHPAMAVISAYLPEEGDTGAPLAAVSAYLEELRREHPGAVFPAPRTRAVASEDWSSSWKVHFKPLKIGRRLLVTPSWEPLPDGNTDLVIRIDPGMAFGTGGHETTRLCLEMLEQVMEERPGVSPDVLDLGTGSGILAMGAVLLGAGRVTAVDIDPLAVDVARENLELNGLAEQVDCSALPLESLKGPFEIILANILAEELVRLSPQIEQRLAPGGRLILSGILSEKEQLVREGFASRTSLLFQRTVAMGEWVAMLYAGGEPS